LWRRATHNLGKKGIGLGKRAPSPTELERLAKVARATEEANKESFRDRSRREFEQRRAETRLGPAQQTCATLDERAGKEVKWNLNWPYTHAHSLGECLPFTLHPSPSPVPVFLPKKKRVLLAEMLVPQFNVLWLDPINSDTFPAGLWDAVASAAAAPAWDARDERSTEERLREQMQADALQPLDDDDDAARSPLPKNADVNGECHWPPRMIQQAGQFLCLNVSAQPVHGSEPSPIHPCHFFFLIPVLDIG
jgi:hypothetical protein